MTCRRCLFWKRRGPVVGTCWQRADLFPAVTSQTGEWQGCVAFQPKVIRNLGLFQAR